MNDFVEQCRREWKRLRVPDSVADEMAAELAADLNEAEAEGVSAEELLGNAVTDPRSFAASWADERAMIPRSGLTARLPERSLVLAAIAALTITTAVGAALVLFASPPASATRAAIGVLRASAAAPTPVRVSALLPISPDGSATVWVGRDGRLMLTQTSGSGVEIHEVGSLLLIVGIAGVIASLVVLFWSSRMSNDWSGRGRHVSDVPPGEHASRTWVQSGSKRPRLVPLPRFACGVTAKADTGFEPVSGEDAVPELLRQKLDQLMAQNPQARDERGLTS